MGHITLWPQVDFNSNGAPCSPRLRPANEPETAGTVLVMVATRHVRVAVPPMFFLLLVVVPCRRLYRTSSDRVLHTTHAKMRTSLQRKLLRWRKRPQNKKHCRAPSKSRVHSEPAPVLASGIGGRTGEGRYLTEHRGRTVDAVVLWWFMSSRHIRQTRTVANK